MAENTEKKEVKTKKAAATKSAAKPKATAAKKETTATKKATGTTKTAAAKKPATKKTKATTSDLEQRYRLVEVAAYYLAEKDGFAGSPVDYWIAAELQISK